MVNIRLYQGHVLPVLQSLPDESVHCVVTSPPYWGLRDYGLEPQLWGGEVGCEHEWGEEQKSPWADHCPGPNGKQKNTTAGHWKPKQTGPFCRLCDVWQGSYGLEPSIEFYVEHTVQIFRELRRMLRKDGVLFLNLGDSYHGGGGAHKNHHANPGLSKSAPRNGVPSSIGKAVAFNDGPNRQLCPGLKAKDLCGVPWRVALALQADGWWLRSDIIWAKPNPMPESCTDRPTTAHEHIFLLTKSAKYFWDAEAVREAASTTRPEPELLTFGPRPDVGFPWHMQNRKRSKMPAGRNLRNVWTIATVPFPQPHFATYPPELVRRCVAAGTSEKGCCPKCGAPWRRVVEKEIKRHEKWYGEKKDAQGARHDRGAAGNGYNEVVGTIALGWMPTCHHYPRTKEWRKYLYEPPLKPSEEIAIIFTPRWWRIYRIRVKNERLATLRAELMEYWNAMDTIPCTVLDPFSGAGTTALVAAKLNRNAIGIELNPEYVEMSRKRIIGEMGRLAKITVDTPGETAV